MTTAESADAPSHEDTAIAVLSALSICHLLNDMMQSLLPSIYPVLKDSYHLDFSQIGFITLAFQLTASLLQPLVGTFTDRYPQPYSAAAGMGMTVLGLGLLAGANSYPLLLAVSGVSVAAQVADEADSVRIHAAALDAVRHEFPDGRIVLDRVIADTGTRLALPLVSKREHVDPEQ